MKRRKLIVFLIFLACMATLLVPALTHAADAVPRGQKLLIYYGIPEGVNQVWDENEAADILAKYDVLVFGEDLEEQHNEHHDSTKAIVGLIRERNPDVRLFGYVDLGVTTVNHSIATLKDKTDKWKAIGADGIFLDDAGFDFGVTRLRMNVTVQYIHAQGMPAFINAWEPNDVMGKTIHPKYNPKGIPTSLRQGDIYLLEDFLVPTDITAKKNLSAFRSSFRKKMESVLQYRKQLGMQVMSVSEADYTAFHSDALRKFFRMNETTAAVFSLDAYGIAPLHYSASRVSRDEVRFFPYIQNYYQYYTTKVLYNAKYKDLDFSRGGFRIHSKPGEHYYNYPKDVQY